MGSFVLSLVQRKLFSKKLCIIQDPLCNDVRPQLALCFYRFHLQHQFAQKWVVGLFAHMQLDDGKHFLKAFEWLYRSLGVRLCFRLMSGASMYPPQDCCSALVSTDWTRSSFIYKSIFLQYKIQMVWFQTWNYWCIDRYWIPFCPRPASLTIKTKVRRNKIPRIKTHFFCQFSFYFHIFIESL